MWMMICYRNLRAELVTQGSNMEHLSLIHLQFNFTVLFLISYTPFYSIVMMPFAACTMFNIGFVVLLRGSWVFTRGHSIARWRCWFWRGTSLHRRSTLSSATRCLDPLPGSASLFHVRRW